MKRKRKQYSGALKAKVGLEAMIGIKTTAQIGREYQVHPLLVTQWKKVLRERMLDAMHLAEAAVEQAKHFKYFTPGGPAIEIPGRFLRRTP